MITTATRTRKSDISRAVGAVLGRDSRSAAHGWDVYDDGVRVIITLNYTLRTTDREAFEDLQDSPLAQRYRLHYTPALLGDDYEHMPADYEGCGVIDLTRREQPTTPATTTQEAPAVPATPTVSVTLPEPFCSYLDMTPMIESNLTETPEEEALVDAYAAARPVQNKTSTSRKITTHSTAALDALIEHADRCADSLAYESTLTEEQRAELKAARTVSVRARDALKSLRTAQEAAQAQQAPQGAQEAPTAFDPADPGTWTEALTPEGYQWREIDTETGEHHLFTPDGTDLSAAHEERTARQRQERPEPPTARPIAHRTAPTATEGPADWERALMADAQEAPTAAITWGGEHKGQRAGYLTYDGPGNQDDREFMIVRAANRAEDGTHRYRAATSDGTFKARGTLDDIAAATAAHLGHATPPALTDPAS